jgi:hypothetical protein
MSSASESVATRSMIYLGMDVRKESITITVLPVGAKTPTRLDRLANDLPKLKRWLDRIARDSGVVPSKIGTHDADETAPVSDRSGQNETAAALFNAEQRAAIVGRMCDRA